MNVKDLFDLSGRTALITGGSRGLGLQIAEALGELGAKVAITARKQKDLDDATAHLQGLGIDVLPIASDVADTSAAAPLVERVIAGLGSIDILVNNAGTSWRAPALEHPLEAWHKVINLNLTGMFMLSQEVGRRC